MNVRRPLTLTLAVLFLAGLLGCGDSQPTTDPKVENKQGTQLKPLPTPASPGSAPTKPGGATTRPRPVTPGSQ